MQHELRADTWTKLQEDPLHAEDCFATGDARFEEMRAALQEFELQAPHPLLARQRAFFLTLRRVLGECALQRNSQLREARLSAVHSWYQKQKDARVPKQAKQAAGEAPTVPQLPSLELQPSVIGHLFTEGSQFLSSARTKKPPGGQLSPRPRTTGGLSSRRASRAHFAAVPGETAHGAPPSGPSRSPRYGAAVSTSVRTAADSAAPGGNAARAEAEATDAAAAAAVTAAAADADGSGQRPEPTEHYMAGSDAGQGPLTDAASEAGSALAAQDDDDDDNDDEEAAAQEVVPPSRAGHQAVAAARLVAVMEAAGGDPEEAEIRAAHLKWSRMQRGHEGYVDDVRHKVNSWSLHR